MDQEAAANNKAGSHHIVCPLAAWIKFHPAARPLASCTPFCALAYDPSGTWRCSIERNGKRSSPSIWCHHLQQCRRRHSIARPRRSPWLHSSTNNKILCRRKQMKMKCSNEYNIMAECQRWYCTPIKNNIRFSPWVPLPPLLKLAGKKLWAVRTYKCRPVSNLMPSLICTGRYHRGRQGPSSNTGSRQHNNLKTLSRWRFFLRLKPPASLQPKSNRWIIRLCKGITGLWLWQLHLHFHRHRSPSHYSTVWQTLTKKTRH